MCALVPPFKAHCDLLILQHPRERTKYYSTAKIVRKAITNSHLMRGVDFEPGSLESALRERDAYVLYPAPGALDVESVELTEKSTVVVLDGTWSEAGKILTRNPYLRSIRALSFKAPLVSNYRIRRQPRAGCLSTIESIAHLLKQNAASHGRVDLIAQYESLLSGFDRMVNLQIQHFPRFSGLPNTRTRTRKRGESGLGA